MKFLVLFTLILALAFPLLAADSSYTPSTPSHKVATLLFTWHDSARKRDVPVKIYYPADAKRPYPLIIFSHGLGGNREGYGYLGDHWAGCGYVCVHVQHIGSDDSVWRGAGLRGYSELTAAAADPQSAINRAKDVSFAIDQMLALSKDKSSPLQGLIYPGEIGMSGHSFGAWTTLAVVGQKTGTPLSFTDPRIKAAIAMSSPVTVAMLKIPGDFGSISVPVFHMTGTLDNSPIGETKAANRRIPYDQSTVPGTCLLDLTGADHMTFSGHLLPGLQKNDDHFQTYILASSTAFWDAMLKGNSAARAWLYQGGFAKMLGSGGTFEVR